MNYLKRKLSTVRPRVKMRYRQYAMKHYDPPVGLTIPHQIISKYQAVLGWSAKGVDSLADRLVFREFTNDDYNAIFAQNNPDVFFDSAVLSALIGSCCFVYLSKDEDERVRLQVIEASNATGVIDPITGLLTEGYAVLQRDDNDNPILEAYFTDEETWFYPKDETPFRVSNPTGVP